MTASPLSPPTVAQLEAVLARTDSAALLISPRILRRVIKADRRIGGLGLQVPHHQVYVVGRDTLLATADRDELGIAPHRELPATVILLPRPESRELTNATPDEILLRGWRLLFHAHVHLAVRELRAAGRLSEAAIRQRIDRLGRTAFAEVRAVLRQENALLPPGGDADVYEEFVALYLELRHLAPWLVSRYFPGVDEETADQVVAADVDAASLLARTHPPEAPDPPTGEPEALFEVPPPEPMPEEKSDVRGGPLYQKRTRWGEQAATRGNAVRAAIYHTRAAHIGTVSLAGAARAAARREVEKLVERLQAALEGPPGDLPAWREPMLALLEPAASGAWPVEARLLFDLQSACVDGERDLYAVDLVEWAVSLGRKAIKRRLPFQGLVLQVKHLRRAIRRLTASRLPEDKRERLNGLLHDALSHTEQRLRNRFRPGLDASLTEVGLTPDSFPVEVSRAKLIEELLDRVVDRGLLTMGDLRDAIARNRLKLPDLAGPLELVTGDKLIRANRECAARLDGVYRRGEIYLRALQRLSSLGFGTVIGRLLTLYLILPLGIAAVSLEGTAYLLNHVLELFPANEHGHHTQVDLVGLRFEEHVGDDHKDVGRRDSARVVTSVGVTSLFVLLLIHVPMFRRGVILVLSGLWRMVRGLAWDLPRLLLRLPVLQLLMQTRAFQLVSQFFLKPLLPTIAVLFCLWVSRAGPMPAVWVGSGTFLLAVVLFNTRLGLQVEEAASDGVVRAWQLLRYDVIPGLVRGILYLFKRLTEDVERILYTVDEWLRFRSGDNPVWLVVKPVLGLVWFVVTYVVRFVINLLVEPQINPIKHFPVVTVGHKFLLLTIPSVSEAVSRNFGIPLAEAVAMVSTITLLIPGIFGFLVWELKENWKLYRANQPPALRPEVVGSHGETVLRLMRPGFHSGTLPKAFARYRRVVGKAARRQEEALHHVEEEIRRFVERDLLALLTGSRRWGGRPVSLGVVRLTTNRVGIELESPAADSEPFELDFEERAGRLVVGVSRSGWAANLPPEPAAAFRDALTGFYHQAGVHLVREQMEAVLPPGADYDFTDAGLLVWPADDSAPPVFYRWDTEPHDLEGGRLLTDELRWDREPVRWADWVEAWQRDREGKPADKRLTSGTAFLVPVAPVTATALAGGRVR